MSVQSLIAEAKENIRRLEETLSKNCWNEGYVKNVTSQIKFYRDVIAKYTPQCSKPPDQSFLGASNNKTKTKPAPKRNINSMQVVFSEVEEDTVNTVYFGESDAPPYDNSERF